MGLRPTGYAALYLETLSLIVYTIDALKREHASSIYQYSSLLLVLLILSLRKER